MASISTTCSSNNQNSKDHDATSAYATALLRSLHFSGVQFIRYCTVDAFNNIRCKGKPVEHLLLQQRGTSDGSTSSGLEGQVGIAEVCYAGLPYYVDTAIDGTGMTAANVLILQPDLYSFRILPYSPKSAVVMGNSVDQYDAQKPSPFCCRSLLGRVVREAKEQHNIAFVSLI